MKDAYEEFAKELLKPVGWRRDGWPRPAGRREIKKINEKTALGRIPHERQGYPKKQYLLFILYSKFKKYDGRSPICFYYEGAQSSGVRALATVVKKHVDAAEVFLRLMKMKNGEQK